MSETAANAETELGTQQDPAATSTPAEPGNVTVSGEPLTPAHAAPKPERPTPRIDDDDEDEDDEDDDEFIPRGQSAHAASGGKPKGGRPR